MKITDSRSKTKEASIDFINQLSESIPVFILGTNKYGLACARFLEALGIRISGFINDISDDKLFHEYQINKSNSDFRGSAIINCVVEGRSVEVENHIRSLLPLYHCDYFSLQFAFSDKLIQVDFLSDTDSIIDDYKNYARIYERLEDKQSKTEFENLINFRFNRNLHFMKDFKVRLKEQYFEDFLNYSNSEVFVDGGCYDGNTSLEFVRLCPRYTKVLVFEPNEKSFSNIKNQLQSITGISYFNKGLWESETTLFFNPNLGSASKIDDNGIEKIETVSIDQIVRFKVDFIKLDIEGAELSALKGALNTIKNYKPILAICTYHNQSDYINLPDYILKLVPSYKMSFRHYTQGVFESVYYFYE